MVPVISNLLTDLKVAMQQDNLWCETVPTPEQLQSTQPFAIDTLTIEQWLQFVFLEKMATILAHGQLPSALCLSPVVVESFQQRRISAVRTVAVIAKIDGLFKE